MTVESIDKAQPEVTPSHIEKKENHDSSTEVLSTSESSDDVPILSEEELRRTRRKADYRLVLWYSVCLPINHPRDQR